MLDFSRVFESFMLFFFFFCSFFGLGVGEVGVLVIYVVRIFMFLLVRTLVLVGCASLSVLNRRMRKFSVDWWVWWA